VTLPAASPSALEAIVRRQRERSRDGRGRVIGVRAQPTWEAGPLTVDGESVRVVGCTSALAVRAELAERGDPAEWLVILTDRDERDLGVDVVGRLERRRLHTLEPWMAVAASFGAQVVDPALRAVPELATALLEHRPPSGYSPTAGAVLDRETAWLAFGQHVLGLVGVEQDPQAAVLSWLSSNTAEVALVGVPTNLTQSFWNWLEERAGVVATFASTLLTSGRGREATALGLCARLLLDANDSPTARVHGRFDHIVGMKLDDEASLAAIAEAAERSAQPGDLARADAMVGELDAKEIVYRSAHIPSGLDGRLGRAGAALLDAVDNPAGLTNAVEAVDFVRRHRDSERLAHRLEALEMAIRLVRYLAVPTRGDAASLADSASSYAGNDAFVDLARRLVWRGETDASLVSAYRTLDERLFDVREAENRRFAQLLADWLEGGSTDRRILGVEEILAEVIAPLASVRPILLVVLDGMGWQTWLELAPDLDRNGWDEFIDEHVASRRIGVATIPSLTTYSRTSLLCGALRPGSQKDEKAGFSAALTPLDALLFHKADLVPAGGSTIAPAVLDAISDPSRRVVGVVINEIDDALSGGLLSDRRFRIPQMGPLSSCLDAALDAGRLCVVTADHGHVVDYEGTYSGAGGGAERWRPATEHAGDREVVLAGKRVLAGDGRVIAPWTERVRYRTGKSAGYHGGATPQEMLVPVAVFAPRGADVPGYRAAAPATPAWWDEGALLPPLVQPAPREPTTLLDVSPPEPAWIAELLGSQLYATQRGRFGRTAPDDERVRRMLSVLAARSGRATVAAIAQAIDAPEHRARGALAGLRRVLAVDGFDVLSIHEDDVALDQRLLAQQFGLGGAQDA
jgi:PglZ domain